MANVRNGRALKSLSTKPQSKLKNKKPHIASKTIGKKTKTTEITPTKVGRNLRKDVTICRIKTRHSTNNHLDDFLTEGLIFERKKKVLKPRKLSGILRLHVNYFELLKKELNLNDNVAADENKIERCEIDESVNLSGKNSYKAITRLNGTANNSPTKTIKPQVHKYHRETLKCSIELPKIGREFPKQINESSKPTKDVQISSQEPIQFDKKSHKKSHKSDKFSNKHDQDTHQDINDSISEKHTVKQHETSGNLRHESKKHSNKSSSQTNNSDANPQKRRNKSQTADKRPHYSKVHSVSKPNKSVDQCKTSQDSSKKHSSETNVHSPSNNKKIKFTDKQTQGPDKRSQESEKESQKKIKEAFKSEKGKIQENSVKSSIEYLKSGHDSSKLLEKSTISSKDISEFARESLNSDKVLSKPSKRTKPTKDEKSVNHDRKKLDQKKRNNRKTVCDQKRCNPSATATTDTRGVTDQDKHGNSATESLKTFFKISPNAISDDLITTDNGLEIFPIYNESVHDHIQPKEIMPKDPYQCDYCRKVFKFKTDMRRHIYVHIDLKPYPCVFCNERFRQISNLKTHIARRHPDSIPKPHSYNCAYCQRIFFVKSIFNAHVARHDDENKVFLCELCPKRFHKKTLLREHMYRHTKKFTCSYCQAVYTTNALLTHHVKVKHLGITENLVCHICGKTFSKAAYIRTHLRNFHGDKKVECPICFKQLKGHVADHMRTHANLRPYACTFCGQKFTQSSQLKVHVRSHTGVRPYKCRICNYSFAHTNALNLHVRVHTGEKPFACFKCYMTFNQLPHLRCHMKKIHGQLECYKCSKCDENFDKKKALVSHEEQCKVGQKNLSFEEKLNLSVKIPEVESTMTISRMRMLLAILLHSIVDDKRLVALGFNARLIDEVLEDSLEATGYDPMRKAGVPAMTRLKINLEKLFQWTVPAENMNKYRRENKSIEEILEDLTKEK